jgi:glutaminyl-tRNA synthetase
LNIGLDSLLFVDDSDYEINLIRERLPEVVTFQVPKNSYLYKNEFLNFIYKNLNLSSASQDLNKTAPRVMAVLDPIKVVISNYPEGKVEWLEAENNQEDESAGFRKVPFSREIFIEREDFMEEAPNKFFRLSLGKEVRLKNAYIIKGESVTKDADGNITEIQATFDTDSLSGSGTEASQRKVAGTLHWVDIKHAIPAEIRLYDRLFTVETPDGHKEKDFLEFVNPDSLKVITGYVEPSLLTAQAEDKFQFQRLGYFTVDKDSTTEHLVFNKTVGLKDAWEEKGKKEENAINNSLKDINKYFKVEFEDRRVIEKAIAQNIESISDFSLLQNAIRKNTNNNKSSLLFANWVLKYSKAINISDVETEALQKLYGMSLKSESSFVRWETIQLLKQDVENLSFFKNQLQEMMATEKNEEVKSGISELF